MNKPLLNGATRNCAAGKKIRFEAVKYNLKRGIIDVKEAPF
jgi:hypothetical protein